jgi:cyclopropane fatty-acyl-phospholipid synthase-like methyltransferase
LGRKSWSFDLRYLLGRPPWDTEVTPPEVIELVEGGVLPPGRALDLGCGTGTNCIYLARHDWEVVGVDFSVLAIRRARRKARRAGVDGRFYQVDVTNLAFLADPFDLALDIGCLHSLSPEDWRRYAAGVARLVLPGGLYLLYTFTPRPDRPISRGVAPEEVRSLFAPAFAVEREERGEDPSGPRSAWYWLRRLYPP